MSLLRALLVLALTALALPLAGCPTGDDDDSGDGGGPVGDAPVLQNVIMCERLGDRQRCADENATGALQLAFDVSVTDVDGDLDNPQYFILLNEQTPWLDGFIEANLGDAGSVRINLGCNFYTLGAPLPWRFAMRDAEGNESAEFTGTFTVPVDEPTDAAGGLCPTQF